MKRFTAFILILALSALGLASCTLLPDTSDARSDALSDALSETLSEDESGVPSQAVSETESADESATPSEAESKTPSETPSKEESKEESVVPDVSEEESKSETKSLYVALGDSIPYGYALVNRERDCYPSLVAASLGSGYTLRNEAISGQTSPQLAAAMSKGGLVDGASLITVTIGANNILGPFFNDTYSIIGKVGLGVTSTEEFFALIVSIVSGEVTDPVKLVSVGEAITQLNAYYNSAEFAAKMDAAATQLNADIATIMAAIDAGAADGAKVVFTTIYSPYKDCAFGFGDYKLDMTELSELAVEKLNKVIRDNAATYSYSVADVFDSFEHSEKDLVNACVDMKNPLMLNVDPHPNKEGAKLIASTVLAAMK